MDLTMLIANSSRELLAAVDGIKPRFLAFSTWRAASGVGSVKMCLGLHVESRSRACLKLEWRQMSPSICFSCSA